MNNTLSDRDDLFKNSKYEINTMLLNYMAVTLYAIVQIYIYIYI